MTKPSLVILAAGMGSRYGGLKQVDPVGPKGESIIDFSIYDAIRSGFEKVIFVIRESFEEEFREKISNKYEGRIDVQFAYQALDTPIEGLDFIPERSKPWGTGHAVLVAKDLIHEPFAVINADDYYGVTSFRDMYAFLSADCRSDHYAMIGYVINNTLSDNGAVSRGIAAMDDDMNLTSMVETKKIERIDTEISYPDPHGNRILLPDYALVSMNFFGFHQNVLDIFHKDFIEFARANTEDPTAEFYIPLVVNKMVQNEQATMKVIPNKEKWYGVTYREDREDVENAFKVLTNENVYPSPLWS